MKQKTPDDVPHAQKQRVISYVDGFNLYFGLKAGGWSRFYWLNVSKLSENLLLSSQELVTTKYFTSRIAAPPDKVKRQTLFIEATQESTKAELIFGQYFQTPFKCPLCAGTDRVPTEKMTDVNIATEMLTDAFQDRFDTALLISADSDLLAPVKAIRRLFPEKRIVVAFPPNRTSDMLKQSASAHIFIGKHTLAASLLPEKITKRDGYVIERPTRWK